MAVREVRQGTTYTDSSDGDGYVRVQHITSVAGGVNDFLKNGVDDVNVPALGDAHPGTGLGHLKARSITARDIGDNVVEVTTTYRPNSGSSQSSEQAPPADNNDNVILNLSFSVQSITVTQDNTTPTPAEITVLKPTAQAIGDGPDEETIPVEKLVPVGILRAERRELDPPMSRMRSVIGRVNSVSQGTGAYAARTLLCTGVSAQTDNTTPDSAKTAYDGFHKVTYEFRYLPTTWDVTVFWTRHDGRQPDAHDANSRKTYTIYEEVNFESLLSIDLSDPS